MYDGAKIVVGLIIFLVLVTFPIWWNVAGGTTDYRPDPKIVTSEKACVMDAAYMKTDHMDVLNEWRDLVVRREARVFHSPTLNRDVEMSLSNTCMSCHSNKSEFCDRCHNYMGVTPYCWDCHVEPEEGGK